MTKKIDSRVVDARFYANTIRNEKLTKNLNVSFTEHNVKITCTSKKFTLLDFGEFKVKFNCISCLSEGFPSLL